MKTSFILFCIAAICFLNSCNINQSDQPILADSTTSKFTRPDTESTNIRKSIAEEIKELDACLEVVMEILYSSPTYIKITKGLSEAVIKNGGKSCGIMLEGSPNPKGLVRQSNTYDFNLHESYPDHMSVIERYSFDPRNEQLYEYDVAADTLIPIDFDRRLLKKFHEICE